MDNENGFRRKEGGMKKKGKERWEKWFLSGFRVKDKKVDQFVFMK